MATAAAEGKLIEQKTDMYKALAGLFGALALLAHVGIDLMKTEADKRAR